jgi:hypothetical protein
MALRISTAQFEALAAAGRGVQGLPVPLVLELRDDDGEPGAHEPYAVLLPDGTTKTGLTDRTGKVHLEHVPRGTCRVTLPRTGQTSTCDAGSTHRIVKAGPRQIVRMQLVDRDGRPRAAARYELAFGDVVRRGSADAEGFLREKVPPGTHPTATLTVIEGDDRDTIELAVGAADAGSDVPLTRREVTPRAEGDDGYSTIAPVWETRHVWIAWEDRGAAQKALLGQLQGKRLPGLEMDLARDRIAYESREQHVRYEVAFGYDATDFGEMLGTEGLLAVHVGHAGAAAASPLVLAATQMRCRALVLLADASLGRWGSSLRARWPRGATDGDAYMLDRTGALAAAGFWIYRLLTYPVPNAFAPWRGALEYAKRRANRDLAQLGEHVRMVTV